LFRFDFIEKIIFGLHHHFMSQVAKHPLLLYDLGQLSYWAIVLIPYKKLAKSAAYLYSNNIVTYFKSL